jgi:predicted dehydrogenase
MSAPIRIVMLGAGRIGAKHIDRIAAHPDFALAGIADIEHERAAAAWPDVPVMADAEALLDAVKPDAALIASPNNLHAAHGIACARRGIPFLVEKPLTDTLAAAGELCAEVRKAGVATLVGHHRRHHPPVLEARRLIVEGAIGDVVGVSSVWATRKSDAYFVEGPWRAEPGGGPILINLVHEIDFLRFCLGEIASVSAVATNRNRGFKVEDAVSLALEFSSGALGSMLVTDAAVSPWTMEQGLGESPEFPFSGESSYRFVGTKGALEFPTLKLWSQAKDPPDWNGAAQARVHFAGRLDPYTAQLTHFRDVVRGAPSLQTVEDGMRTLAATLAANEASARRVCVKLN